MSKEKIRDIKQNNKGFSLMELMVSAALFAILSMASVSIISFIKVKSLSIEKKASKKIEEEWLNKVLYKIIFEENIGVSYGILNIVGENNKNFLDYYPDYHTLNLSAGDKKRTFKLSNGKQILFLSSEQKSKRLNLMELFNYKISNMLERSGSADDSPPNKAFFNDCYLQQELNFLWSDKQLVLFYVPAFLRESATLNMAEFPKKPAFLAYMDGTGKTLKNSGGTDPCPKQRTTDSSVLHVKKYDKLLTSNFNFQNPAPGGNVYTDIKDFVLKSHLISGRDAVIAERVKVLILSMTDNKAYWCVVRKEDDPLTCGPDDGLLFAENLEHITFTREDISNLQIQISFEFLDE